MTYLTLAKKIEEDLKHKRDQGLYFHESVVDRQNSPAPEADFTSMDRLASYYADEIPFLRDKTPEQLQEIHEAKLSFPGCRIIQEWPEK